MNGRKLYQFTNDATSKFNKVNRKANKVCAGAAALAALHPLDFNPNDKLNFSIGFGNYSTESEIALSAFYNPNEDTIFSIDGPFGNDANMINAGLTLKLGKKSNKTYSQQITLEKEVYDLKNIIKAQNKEIEEIKK